MNKLKQIFHNIFKAISGAWKFFAGVVVTVVIFYGNFFDLKQPSVRAEITEIIQSTSPDIDLAGSPLFPKTRQILRISIFGGGAMKIEDIKKALDASQQSNNDALTLIQKLKDLSSDEEQIKINKTELSRLLRPISVFSAESSDDLTDVEISSAIANRARDQLERQKQIDDARKEVSDFEKASEKSEAKIILTTAISNSGDGSTTLKPQGLLRTDLGENNYLDIPVRMVDYEQGNAELKSRSANIVKWQSNPIKDMSPEDRNRFIDFFKNTSPTTLYITDVRGNFFASNVIPFAQGIYDQRIYDDLKTFASRSTALGQ